MNGVRVARGDAWALAAATLAAAFARRAPADGEWPAGARRGAVAAAASNAAPAASARPRSCASVVGEALLPEADAADVVMERLAACDDPTTLAAFCRARAAVGGVLARDYARALAALARCTAALAPVLERCEAGAADDDDWAAARAPCARRGSAGRAPASKDGGRAGHRAGGVRGDARASERRACRDAVAAFYDDATDAPAKQSEADDDVLVDAADDAAFHVGALRP